MQINYAQNVGYKKRLFTYFLISQIIIFINYISIRIKYFNEGKIICHMQYPIY